MSFVHLHVHTNFSFGDGAGRIDELVDAARRFGMPALAITDHDGLYGAVRFYQACKAAGVKPIVGVEISVESVLAAPAAGAAAAGAAEAVTFRRGASGGPAAAGPLALRCGTPSVGAASAESAKEGPGGEGRSEREHYPGQSPGCRTLVREACPEPPGASAADAPAAPVVPRVSTTDLSPSPPRGQFAAAGYHLVLLARDYRGWSQLCRIVSAAHLEPAASRRSPA